jgi:hypothetical protein
VALGNWVFFIFIARAVTLFIIGIDFGMKLVFISQLEVDVIVFRCVVVANQLAISWDRCAFLDNNLLL